MDDLRTRLDALEHQTATLTHHTRHVTRQLRWWRGVACGVMALALLTWALPVSTAQEDARSGGLASRLAALEHKLRYLTVSDDAETPPEVRITGANLRIINGLNSTDCTDDQSAPIPDCPNGVGNLIVGYNELRPFPEEMEDPNVRTGSHNVVVGQEHNFSRFGGLVVGFQNEISGDWSAVSGGQVNTASSFFSVVSGGSLNTASGVVAVISGGGGITLEEDGGWAGGSAGGEISGSFRSP